MEQWWISVAEWVCLAAQNTFYHTEVREHIAARREYIVIANKPVKHFYGLRYKYYYYPE
jgi:hypothetical protein